MELQEAEDRVFYMGTKIYNLHDINHGSHLQDLKTFRKLSELRKFLRYEKGIFFEYSNYDSLIFSEDVLSLWSLLTMHMETSSEELLEIIKYSIKVQSVSYVGSGGNLNFEFSCKEDFKKFVEKLNNMFKSFNYSYSGDRNVH